MQVIGEHESSLKRALNEFGVYLKPSSYGQDVKPLLKESCKAIFGNSAGLVDMMVQHFPSSKEGSASKVLTFGSILSPGGPLNLQHPCTS